MAEFGLNRNGSGYYDETAYKAFMGMAKAGDIWTTFDGREEVLILRNQGTLCNCLSLTDKAGDARCIEIDLGHPPAQDRVLTTLADCKQSTALVGKADLYGLRYTNPSMVKYLFHQRLGKFVRKIPDGEFAQIMEAVWDAMGFRKPEVKADKRAIAHDLLDMILDKVGGL